MIEQVKGTRNIANEDSAKFLHVKNNFINKNYFFSYKILAIFINNQNVINIGISYFNIFSFAIPFVTLSMICSRTIQGLGKSYPMFIITCLRVIIISCSLGWYFIAIKKMPIEYAWFSILISCICASIISSIWLIIELKKIKQS